MKIKEIKSKTIITPSQLPDADFVINPFVGCQHGCIYCYAEFMKKYTNHSEDWGKFIDIKLNSPDLIKNSNKYNDKKIFISSVTDPYTPIEKKFKITRNILKKLVGFNTKIEILTKSQLILRDINLLKQLSNITIGFSIASLNDEICKKIEPKASLSKNRISALKKFKRQGFKTYLFLSPIFPEITEVREIIDLSCKYVDFFMFENLNVRKNNRERIYAFIKNNRPELYATYKDIFETKKKPHEFWLNLQKKIEKICGNYKIESRIYFQRIGIK